jgi:DNA-binding MarR family transcriptional regulator
MKIEPIEKKLHINALQLNAYSTGLLQGKAYNRLHKYLTNILLPYNVSVPEWKLLGQLFENHLIKLNELADLLSYDPPMVTKLVKRLEKKDLVKREQDPKDERAKIISITREGSKLIEEVEPKVKMTMAMILNGISREDLNSYIKVLITIVNNTRE